MKKQVIAGCLAAVVAGMPVRGVAQDTAKKISGSTPAEPASLTKVTGAINATASHLFVGLPLEASNVLFSPIGYARAGETTAALQDTARATKSDTKPLIDYLQATPDPDVPSNLVFSDVAWTARKVPPVVAKRIQATSGVDVWEINESPRDAAENLASWLSQNSNGKMQVAAAVFASKPNTVIGSAARFRGEWVHQFEPAGNIAFHAKPSQTVELPAMRLSANVPYLKSGEVELLVLPLAPEANDDKTIPNFMFLMMLPPAGGDVVILRSSLTADKISRWLSTAIPTQQAMDAWEKKEPQSSAIDVRNKWLATYPLKWVTATVPKFVLQSPPAAIRMALPVGVGADTTFVQNCAMTIDENGINEPSARRAAKILDAGTTAVTPAAATTVPATAEATESEVVGEAVSVTADRPMLIAVVERNTGTIVFGGQVNGAK